MEITKKHWTYIFTISLFTIQSIAPLIATHQGVHGKALISSGAVQTVPATQASNNIRPSASAQALSVLSPTIPLKPSLASTDAPRELATIVPQGVVERMQWLQIKRHFGVAQQNNNEAALINIKHFVSPYFIQLLRKMAAKESEDIISIFEGLSGIPAVRDVLTEGVIDFFEIYTASESNEQKRRRFSGMVTNMRMKLSQATSLLTADRVSISERAYKFFVLLDNLAHSVTRSISERVYARLGSKGLMALAALVVGGGLVYWKGNEAYSHVKDKVINPVQTMVKEGGETMSVLKRAIGNYAENAAGEGAPERIVSKLMEKENVDIIFNKLLEHQQKTKQTPEQLKKLQEELGKEVLQLKKKIDETGGTFNKMTMSPDKKRAFERLNEEYNNKRERLRKLESGDASESFAHASAKGLGEGAVLALAKNPELIEKVMPGLTGKTLSKSIGSAVVQRHLIDEIARRVADQLTAKKSVELNKATGSK